MDSQHRNSLCIFHVAGFLHVVPPTVYGEGENSIPHGGKGFSLLMRYDLCTAENRRRVEIAAKNNSLPCTFAEFFFDATPDACIQPSLRVDGTRGKQAVRKRSCDTKRILIPCHNLTADCLLTNLAIIRLIRQQTIQG